MVIDFYNIRKELDVKPLNKKCPPEELSEDNLPKDIVIIAKVIFLSSQIEVTFIQSNSSAS